MHVDDLAAVAVATAQDLEDRFGAALAAKDAAALRAMFDDEVDFRAMTPDHIWEAQTPTAVIDDVILGTWFASCGTMELVETADTGMVGDRHSFSYRLQGTNGDGRFVIEQRAYYDIAQGRITWMRVLCSGFQPLTGHP